MSDDRDLWERFTRVLDAAPAERDQALAVECGDDSELRRQLVRLLELHAETNPHLEDPSHLRGAGPTQPMQSTPPAPADEERVGPYEVVERIGAGGMGVVYLAEQSSPIQRRVALKIIKQGMDSREIVARFEAERQTLALMNHPSIARIFDAGITERGQPYFAMEYIEGAPISEFCDRHELSIEARLQLFCAVCAAVQHAHQKGVIHRDLKPSNVLVVDQEGTPLPKIIDFGVAKATSESGLATLHTMQGMIIGTPEYMSPEQAAGVDIDTRADVYSLGAILYELLTGDLPIDSHVVRSGNYTALQRHIREDTPARPSTRLHNSTELTTIAEKRSSDGKALVRSVSGDLDWIVMRALEKERDQRYASPLELAEDVERHLAHEAVLAGPPSLTYQVVK